MISQELIERFLRNECTANEKEQVLRYLDEHPDELDAFFPAEECFNAENNSPDKETSERMLDNVHRQIQKKNNVVSLYRRLIAAACIVLVCGAAWIWIGQQSRQTNKNIAATASTSPEKNILQKRFNTTDKVITISMPDGSVIELQPASGISYPEPFGKDNERTIYLNGEAMFKVAKDKTKPFIVYTGGISTTALGTSFNICYYDEKDITSVVLYTGKVVIKPAGTTEKSLDEDVFLTPGQQLVYNRQTRHAQVQLMPVQDLNGGRNKLVSARQKYAGAVVKKPTWYMFNGQTLEQVLDQLSVYYNVDIEYVPAEIDDKYFTAKFDTTDALDQILRDIATLNHLKLKKEEGKYIIRKNHH